MWCVVCGVCIPVMCVCCRGGVCMFGVCDVPGMVCVCVVYVCGVCSGVCGVGL